MIRRSRTNLQPPKSLDPSSMDFRRELEHNEAVVNKNRAVPWKKWSVELKFELYAKDLDVKKALSDLFHNKCAYCEISLDGQHLHTEHYRPKGEVHKIDDPSQRGYWWLAASWSNLLPACGHCNQSPGTDHPSELHYGSGKGIRFPLVPGTTRAILPGDEIYEDPILINPAEEEPSDYISFHYLSDQSFAAVKHLRTTREQMRATGTIEICGLNRYGIVRERTKHLRCAANAARALIEATNDLNSAYIEEKNRSYIEKYTERIEKCVKDIYDLFLSPSSQFLHATVLHLERELRKANLCFKDLFGSVDLHLPDDKIE